MSDLPHITVATVVERQGRFLMVKERSTGAIVYNQPAGHLENGESLIAAACRETLEETRWRIEVTALLGIYHYRSSANNVTYIRHCFIARALEEVPQSSLDPDIIEAVWLSRDEIADLQSRHRSPIVMAAIDDFNQGISFPLTLIHGS
jgi:8-oxo-dGTP pyrophosphatase MutT (NUDIX family)